MERRVRKHVNRSLLALNLSRTIPDDQRNGSGPEFEDCRNRAGARSFLWKEFRDSCGAFLRRDLESADQSSQSLTDLIELFG